MRISHEFWAFTVGRYPNTMQNTNLAALRYFESCITACIALKSFSEVKVSRWSLSATQLIDIQHKWRVNKSQSFTISVRLRFLWVGVVIAKHRHDNSRCTVINRLEHAQQAAVSHERPQFLVTEQILLRQPAWNLNIRRQIILANWRLVFPEHSVRKFGEGVYEQFPQVFRHVGGLDTRTHADVDETEIATASDEIFQILQMLCKEVQSRFWKITYVWQRFSRLTMNASDFCNIRHERPRVTDTEMWVLQYKADILRQLVERWNIISQVLSNNGL